ncbi:MAG: hypothetical protein EB078_07780 [Proteobacteria bacterium]|nr:hypothetical protein [Pseudomonadota bacterium]NDC24999.1 hypothetical protein [Pseudomonadota bacterium]NDD04791.1 hypothetical protein [Pseudomonadota bacterium]NDG27238.1 hypothetical protein [Pseudomonadota bacterium]
MRVTLTLLLVLLSLGAFEKPAEAGFFFGRPGPLRRLLFFGGPFRRRFIARSMFGPRCVGCVPRGMRVPRCGRGLHGGGCGGFNGNQRNFLNPFQRNNQFDSVFDPGIGLTQAPFPGLAPTSAQVGRGPQAAKPEPAADRNDPCGIRFGQIQSGVNRISEGFYFDRRSNTCEYGFRQFGNNPFPFRSESECQIAVRNGACTITSLDEANQTVFRR